MVVGFVGYRNDTEKDYSFVKEEIKNLKNIPKDYDDDLYRKLGISKTVIAYWHEIEYIPPYYYLFCLLQKNRNDILFEEYRKICDMLADKICEESEKLGEAVKDFCNLEHQGYEWFIKSSRDFVYILSYSYDDGSGSSCIQTWNYDEVMECMRKHVEEDDRDVSYEIVRFSIIYSEDGRFEGIDLDDFCGKLWFDSKGRLKDICDIKGFGYDPMCELQLTNPYIFIPHPFKKGDIAYYYYDDKRYYGVVSHPCTEELSREREERGISCDGSDFLAVIETADKKEDGSFTMGFSHICPLYMEKYNEEIKYEQGNELSVLAFASEIITGKSSSLSSLMYFMKQ